MSNNDVTITPGKRLARALRDKYVADQVADGRTVWYTPAILPWQAWMNSLLDEYVATGEEVNLPLAPNQSLRVWGDIVREDVLVGSAGVALMALRAWTRMHEWLLEPVSAWESLELSPDAAQFAAWAERYEAILAERGWIDQALWQRRLPEMIAEGVVRVPDRVLLKGFIEVMPDGQRAIVEALKAAGVSVFEEGVDRAPVRAVVTEAADRDDELDQVAAWARDRLEAGDRRIGIVVPDLSARIPEVERSLRRALRPDLAQLDDKAPLAPWHIALGEPLVNYPVVAQALSCLALRPSRLDKAAISDLLRSPFVGGWRLEQSERANLDLEARRLPGEFLSLSRLVTVARARKIDVPMLYEYLDAWGGLHAEHGRGDQMPSDWARQFTKELDAIGYGTGRTLSSMEYQAWEAWQEVLEELSGMDAVAGDLDRDQALGLLQSLAELRSFRPQNYGCPIEVMSVTEALGGDFDALWVTGMDDSRWPEPAQPDPLLPRHQQRHCPDATAEGQLERARDLLAGLCQASDRVVMSHAALDGELPMSASILLSRFQEVPIEEIVTAREADWPAPAAVERIEGDDVAPAVTEPKVKGGTRVLFLQSACPFRAMAEQRLGARAPDEIRGGINLRDRGSMLHDALEHFWRHVQDSSTLRAMSEEERTETARDCAGRAVGAVIRRNPLAIPESMESMEIDRLTERLLAWLAIELERPDFRVVAIEEEASLQAGGLELKVKLDRIDEIEGGGKLPIDYKTGKAEPSSWFPSGRMRDPQLPAYALTMGAPPAGLAFARLRPDQIGFAGLSEVATDIRGLTPLARANRGLFREINDWDELLTHWRHEVDALAAQFRGGEAAVAPRDPSVCDHCQLKSLCRIRHRMEAAQAA